MNAESIRSIIAQYERHGWKLRRCLVADHDGLRDLELADGVEVVSSDLNSLWFSRVSRPGTETWELRRLEEIPFAVLTTVPENSTEIILEKKLSETEQKMLSIR